MAEIYLACAASMNKQIFAKRDFERLRDFASKDKIKDHVVTDNPAEADIIVFVGSSEVNYSDVRNSELYRKYKHKSLVLYSGDKGIPLLPGLYTSLEKRWSISRNPALLSGIYLRIADNTSLDIEENINNAEHLFSFVGNAQNHHVRKQVCSISAPRSYLRDTSADTGQQDDGVVGENKERGILYRDVMAKSKFILCPRGIGVSSWRLFETMRAGRVPVIISDDWIPPVGPEWVAFAIFVKEDEIASLPALLEEQEPSASVRGALARQQWEAWYAKDVIFNTIVNLLLLAQSKRNGVSFFIKALQYTQYLEPHYLRHWMLFPIKGYIKNLLRRS
jgi:hypothetical protein